MFQYFVKLCYTYRFRGKIKGNLLHSLINSFRQKDIGKRFQILKDIELDGKTTERLDEISVQLKDHITAVQELAVLKYIKSGHRAVTRKGMRTKTIEESSDKKQATTKDNQLIGKYQKTPSVMTIKNLKDKSTVTPKKTVHNDKSVNKVEAKGNVEKESDCQNTDKTDDKQTRMSEDDIRLTNTLKDLKNNKYFQDVYRGIAREYNDQSYLQLVKDSRSGLENVGESCWFNSVVQMFSNTKFMRKINEQFHMELSYKETSEQYWMSLTKLEKETK
ncbi:unnamed protein product [Mytilus coruscus]|uniref:USP domain-containing protein n=1 Tax=Mytilus coruscus TaxID=42192 RepID=A0A6J8BM53_MYTCO|nr:unnamed protein product [Mytilus coruscus]